MEESREKRVIVEYYDRLRQKQIAEGTYDPFRNGNPASGGLGHIDSRNVIRIDNEPESCVFDKYDNDPTLI